MKDNRIKIQKALALDNLSSVQIANKTGLSQPTVSRSLAELPVKKIGAGRATRFAWIEDSAEPIFQINPQGKAEKVAYFYRQPNQRCLVAFSQNNKTQAFTKLPHFMMDLIPSGFLAEIGLEQIHRLDSRVTMNSLHWSHQDFVYFLTHYGTDLSGNLMFGRHTVETWLHTEMPIVKEADYTKVVKELASGVNRGGWVVGKQPKFTCYNGTDHLLVKYTPKLDAHDPLAIRYKDLLVCEFLALQTLGQTGLAVSEAKLVQAERLYLQLKRFDRVGEKGRRGLISLKALADHYIGETQNWPLTADALFQQGVINEDEKNTIHLLYAFGAYIGNNDRHLANISFYFEDFELKGLAPIYDMLPMRLMPKNGELPSPKWQEPALFDVAPELVNQAKELAKYYIKRVFENYLISYDTKKLFNQG
ncbi:HipA domain-containing protein [Thiomicrospira pelophila]|uniref:HipA domain-containing protein n=1 Tax=Thiomicrospira pelophila TaxID=934 RepID=UPI0004A6DC8F|nr:HipA domain-containing protein [Thiomicrospira pelophila]